MTKRQHPRPLDWRRRKSLEEIALTQPSQMFDARPARTQVLLALVTALFVFVIWLATIPYWQMQLPANTGFLPAYGGITGFADLFTAALLIGQARALASPAPAALGAAYLFSFLMVVPHLMAFPGVFAAEPIIGTSASATWLWCAWHLGFALYVANYAVFASRQTQWQGLIGIIFTSAVISVVASIVLATVGLPILPEILVGGSYRRMNTLGIGPIVLVCNTVALILVFVRLRGSSTIALWLGVAMLAATLDVFLGVIGNSRFTVGWYLGRGLSLFTNVVMFIALSFQSLRLSAQVFQLNEQLERLSLTDALTRLPNRRAFEASYATEWKQAKREQRPISLLMIDIDYFKGFNDALGHPAGDRCLQLVADTLSAQLRRPVDMGARFGGEEFVVLLPNTEAHGALVMGERIRAAIEALNIVHPSEAGRLVTISVGVATAYPFAAEAQSTTILEQADAALYRAKRRGRNVVEVMEQAIPKVSMIDAFTQDTVRGSMASSRAEG